MLGEGEKSVTGGWEPLHIIRDSSRTFYSYGLRAFLILLMMVQRLCCQTDTKLVHMPPSERWGSIAGVLYFFLDHTLTRDNSVT